VEDSADDVTLRGIRIDGSCGPPDRNTMYLHGERTIIEDNEITNGNVGRACILIGQSPSGYDADHVTIRRNVIHDCGHVDSPFYDHGIYLFRTTGTRIEHNVLYNLDGGFAVHFWGRITNTVVANNTSDGGPITLKGGYVIGTESGTPPSGNVIENNIITHTPTAGFTGYSGSDNLVRNNCFWETDGQFSGTGFTDAGGNVTGDPAFVDRLAHDYRLQPGSPCAGKGALQ
jgi:hypothetical protein